MTVRSLGLSSPERFLLVAACLVVVIAGLRAAGDVIVPFLLAAFIAVTCLPPLLWLHSHRVPNTLAVLLVVLLVSGLGLGLALSLGTSLNDFSQALPSYQAKLRGLTADMLQRLRSLGIAVPSDVVGTVADPAAVMRAVARVLTGVGGLLANGFLILLTVVFILLEASALPGKLRAAFGSSTRSLTHMARFSEGLKRYLAIKTTISLVTGIAVGILLAVLGVNHAFLWSLLAFLLNFVPNIGSIIAAVPAILVALIQFGVTHAVLAAGGYIAINILTSSILEPRYLGRGLGLSTLVVFVSLVFWGWVLGPVGMLLSVPLTMVVKIALESRKDTRWLAVLLDSHGLSSNEAADLPAPKVSGGA